MNQARLVWLGIALLALAVLFKTSLVSDIISLLIFGMVPDSDATIPAWVMLTVYPLLLIGAVFWLSSQSLLIGEKKKPVKAKAIVKKTTRKPPARKRATKTAAKRRTRTAT